LQKKVLNAPVPVGKDNYRTKDQAVWMTITNRNTKFNAPKRIQPKGNFKTKSELMLGFKNARKQTVSFMKDTKIDLRNRLEQLYGTDFKFEWQPLQNGGAKVILEIPFIEIERKEFAHELHE